MREREREREKNKHAYVAEGKWGGGGGGRVVSHYACLRVLHEVLAPPFLSL